MDLLNLILAKYLKSYIHYLTNADSQKKKFFLVKISSRENFKKYFENFFAIISSHKN